MADPVNSDIERAFALVSGPLAIVDDNVATVVSSQATGLRARGQMFVVTSAASGASIVLPSINGGDAAPYLIVVNETQNVIRIGGAAGDSVNGTLTSANFLPAGTGNVSVTARSSAICIASQVPLANNGGSLASPNNWHVVVIA